MTDPRSGGTPAAASEPNDGRWSAERLASEPAAEVLELLLQLQWRVARGGTQQEAMLDAKRELNRRLKAVALPPVAPEPSAHEIASEVERLGAEVASLREALANFAARRPNFHNTYNGGWHGSADGMRAFHHGMDTVFNALDAEVARGALAPASREPQKEQEKSV